MKYLLFLSFLLLLPLQAYSATISDFNPVAHWTFDESSGVRYDSTSNANDLTDNNTVSSAIGLLSTAADFEASNSEYLSNAGGIGLSTNTNHTISFWYKPESTGTHQTSIYTGDTTSGLHIRINDNTKLFTQFANSSGETKTTSGSALFTAGNWYHVVVVLNVNSDSFEFYINGSLVAETVTGTAASGFTDGSTLCIGATNCASQYLDGLVDEFSIFPSALNSTQVTTIYNTGTPLPYQSTPDTGTVPFCVYTNTYDMNGTIGQTCVTDGSTSTCTYDFSPTTTPLQTYDGDNIFMLAFVVFFLVLFSLAFFMSPFKRWY